jgi:hypothetical protein
MKNIIKNITVALLIATTFVACKKDKEDLQIPDNYDGSTFDANTVQEYEIRAQLKTLTDEMKKGRVNGVTVDASTLNNLYNAGTKSLSSITVSQYSAQIQALLNELATASGGTYDATLPVSGQGGTYGGSTKYLFDENGVELEQLVEKGLFGAALYNYAASQILTGDVDQAKLDKALALFGANPTFANSNDGSKHQKPDVFGAVYAARRDDNSGNGIYLSAKKNFIKAQAAIKAGSDYNEERDEAINEILLNWEKGLAATIIHYSFDGINKLSTTSPDDASRAGALHSLGENVGFAAGLKFVVRKKIKDTTIDAVLTKLKYPYGGPGIMHEFVKNPTQATTELQEVINLLKSEYGFSDAEIEGFKNNWISVQQR